MKIFTDVLIFLENSKHDGTNNALQCITNLIELHKLFSIHFLCFIQGSEFHVLGRKCFICKGTLDSVIVMSTNGHQRSLSGEVLVQFVLEGNERVVARLVELDTAENGACNIWPYPLCLEV